MAKATRPDRALALGGGPARLTRTVALVTLVVLGLSYVLNAMDPQVSPVLTHPRERR